MPGTHGWEHQEWAETEERAERREGQGREGRRPGEGERGKGLGEGGTEIAKLDTLNGRKAPGGEANSGLLLVRPWLTESNLVRGSELEARGGLRSRRGDAS